jgi:hypothetical protein
VSIVSSDPFLLRSDFCRDLCCSKRAACLGGDYYGIFLLVYLLFTDETNKEESARIRFFIYGGLFIPVDKAGQLHVDIEALRRSFGYAPAHVLKFDTNARPKHLSQEEATKLKTRVIDACAKAGCKFSALIIHHKIAKGENPENKYRWAANHIIGHFNYFLATINDYGVCMLDSLPVRAPYQYLAKLFTHGLDLPGEKSIRLDRIVATSNTCICASHFSSAVDVVLGTFRYCVNNPSDADKVKTMLTSVAKLMWYAEKNGHKYVRERGLIVRPKVIKLQSYQKEYDALINQMDRLLKDV